MQNSGLALTARFVSSPKDRARHECPSSPISGEFCTAVCATTTGGFSTSALTRQCNMRQIGTRPLQVLLQCLNSSEHPTAVATLWHAINSMIDIHRCSGLSSPACNIFRMGSLHMRTQMTHLSKILPADMTSNFMTPLISNQTMLVFTLAVLIPFKQTLQKPWKRRRAVPSVHLLMRPCRTRVVATLMVLTRSLAYNSSLLSRVK